jgi:hypothetical protein
MAGTEIAKRDSNEISLDFGVGKGLSLDGLTPEQQNELAFKLQSKKLEVAVDVAERKARLESSVADSANVVNSANALDGTRADFNITSESATASGTTKISVHKNNNLALYILIALGILAVVAFVVFRG